MRRRRMSVAIEVFDGNTADPMTLPSLVTKLKERFGVEHRVARDEARIAGDLRTAGPGWISALRASVIKKAM